MTEVTKPKPRRPESATCYAIRRKSDGKWWSGFGDYGSFADAAIHNARNQCFADDGEEIVPCRVRVLPSAKRNRTRTR